MVFLNKYLREIGIDEKYWLFSEDEKDERNIPNNEGFIEAEFFSLDTSLSLYIYSHLCFFKENYAIYATPSCFCYNKNGEEIDHEKANKKWLKVLDEMIDGFKFKLISRQQMQEILKTEDYDEINKIQNRIINKGMKKFIKYYDCLWF